MRMDNCYLDSLGVLTLVRGIQLLNATAFSSYSSKIYSKTLESNSEAIWVALGIPSTSVIRSASGTFNDSVVVANGTDHTYFGDCLGEVLIFSGTARIKDDTVNFGNLGLQPPAVPTITDISQQVLNIFGVWTGVVGTVIGSDNDSIFMTSTATNVVAIALETLSGPTDTTIVGGGAADNPTQDTIQFNLTPDDPSNVTKIVIEFLSGSYAYQYAFDPTALSQGPQQLTTLTATRGQFKRAGSLPDRVTLQEPTDTTQFDWTKVTAVRFSLASNTQQSFGIGTLQILGGVQGQINGNYSYIQVNVTNNGLLKAKSPPSPATAQYNVFNGQVVVTPSNSELAVTEVWIYRFGGNLDQYYRVGITNPDIPFLDNVSDDTLLEIDLALNPFLITVQPVPGGLGLQDTIYGVEGLFYDRMLYMGEGFIYISDSLNPDAIDSRYTIKAFGDPSEENLWIKKLTNNVCILGTSKNLYELTGTFQPLPDGTLDVSINPIGENHPPITQDVCSSQGNIFYMAADGVRQTQGSNSINFSPPLRLLAEGETRSDFPPFVISAFTTYPMAIGKTRFMVSIPLTDGSQRLFIYDLINNYWRVQDTDPVSIFTTPTDRVLLGYNNFQGFMGGSIALLDTGLGFTDSSGEQIAGYALEIRTVFDANGQPRNRKDTFTMKLIVDTGGQECSVYIGKDQEGDPYQFVGNFTTMGLTTVYFPLDNFTLGFRYSVRIVDSNSNPDLDVFASALLTFTLYELTIEYDPRPEQLDYLRIQPNNLGTISRKRMVNYAFVIDTLGNDITFTPYIDNSNMGILPASRIFSTPAKQTYIYYFTQEQIGTDINGILSGGVFEFYSVNLEEIISERMPVPCEYLVIPNNDYGTPDRKRHSSYKFQINTRGSNVQFTPKLDGVFFAPATYNTIEKRVVEYFFDSDTIARDIGGVLQSLVDGNPFEFYGVVTPQTVEKLPDRLTYYRIPNDNFGVPSMKRVRTIPLVIDTYGQTVTFQPIVDQLLIAQTAQFQTFGKQTVLFYFNTDSFGIDYGGQISSNGEQPFEFYGMPQPAQVEALPIGKVYDQLGPVRFDKIGKIFAFRVRMISTGNTELDLNIPWSIIGDSDPTIPGYGGQLIAGTISAFPGVDYVYEVQLPKSVNTDVCRLTIGPTDLPFYRYDCYFRVSSSGMESDSQWIPVR